MKKGILVFPLHDKDGILFDMVLKNKESLKDLFSKTVVSLTPTAVEINREKLGLMEGDDFFEVVKNEEGSILYDHFMNGYKRAAEIAEDGTIVHVETADRLIFQMECYKEEYRRDIVESDEQKRNTLFVRSEKAWASHPKNYYVIETLGTKTGEMLTGKKLDFFLVLFGGKKG